MSQAALLRTRRFGPFFWTQLLGALNDNVFKNALVILFAFGTVGGALRPDVLVNFAGGVFVLPFFLFSATAGQLADRYEKARIIRAVKLLEIGIMSFGAVGFALGSAGLLLAALFLMGTHSALFGPVKFSILPQHLRDDELMAGNALVEMGTFVAILLGTILGGIVVAIEGHGPHAAALLTIAIAVLGWLASRRIPAAAPAEPGLRIRWSPVRETWRLVGYARQDRRVWLAVLGISWFWFYGALFLAQFPGLGRAVLGGDEHVVTLLLAVFSIGVGAGCLWCGRLSGGVVELGLVPIGAVGLTLFALDLAHAAAAARAPAGSLEAQAFLRSASHWRVAFDLAAIGGSGGFFIVPLLAFVQQRSDPRRLARIIAANNVVTSFAMVVAAAVGMGLAAGGVTQPQLFVLTGVVNAVVVVWMFVAVPELPARFVARLAVRAAYRVEHRDLGHVPPSGAALLVADRTSVVDPLVIAAFSPRPVRLVVERDLLRIPLLGFLLRTFHAISMAPRNGDRCGPEDVHGGVAEALGRGELVCLLRGAPGADAERIVARASVPIVPLALRRVGERRTRRALPRMGTPVELVSGPAIAPGGAAAAALEASLRALGDAR